MSNVSKSFRKSLAAIPEASSAECGDKAIFDRLQRPALRANLFLEEGLSAGGVCLAPEHPVHTGEVRVASGHIRHSRGGTLGRVRAGVCGSLNSQKPELRVLQSRRDTAGISSLAHVMRWFDRVESNVLALGNTKVQRSTPSRVSDTSQCCNQQAGG